MLNILVGVYIYLIRFLHSLELGILQPKGYSCEVTTLIIATLAVGKDVDLYKTSENNKFMQSDILCIEQQY